MSKHVLTVEEDLALGDFIVVLAGQNVGQGRLAGAVRPHDGMDFARFDGQVDAAQDFRFVFRDAGVKVFDLKHETYVLVVQRAIPAQISSFGLAGDQPTDPSRLIEISF